MARRTLNRMELRRAAESAQSMGDGNGGGPTVTPAATKKESKPKVTKPRKSAKSKAPVRMRVRWAVVNDSLKQVAIFDYPQRTEAEQKAADLIEKGKGHHFVRGVKEPMPEIVEPVAS
jgi:hypothetical protein